MRTFLVNFLLAILLLFLMPGHVTETDTIKHVAFKTESDGSGHSATSYVLPIDWLRGTDPFVSQLPESFELDKPVIRSVLPGESLPSGHDSTDSIRPQLFATAGPTPSDMVYRWLRPRPCDTVLVTPVVTTRSEIMAC